MVRSTSVLLVVVMLLASGRLLACGWECSDELAVTAAAASCHQESAPVTALNGDAAHACLPDIAEPHVTVAKPASALPMAAAPLVTVFITQDYLTAPRYSSQSFRFAFASPHSPARSVLRI